MFKKLSAICCSFFSGSASKKECSDKSVYKTQPESSGFSEQDHVFMQQALLMADEAERNNEIPVGAVLVQNNKIIARGCNRVISQHDPSAHAEVAVLREAGQQQQNYRLPETTLYVTLEPCAMCAMALVHARVERVVFGASDGKTGAAGSVYSLLDNPQNNHRIKVEGGLLQPDCSHKLSAFFKRRRQEHKQRKLSKKQSS